MFGNVQWRASGTGLTLWSHTFGTFGINKCPLGHPTGRLQNLDWGQVWWDGTGSQLYIPKMWHVAAAAMTERSRKRGEHRSVQMHLLKRSCGHPSGAWATLSSKSSKSSFSFLLLLGSQGWHWKSPHPHSTSQGQRGSKNGHWWHAFSTHSKGMRGKKKWQ